MTTPRVPIVARRFQVIGGLPWAQTFRFTVPILDEAGKMIGKEPEDVSAYSGWASDWRATPGAAVDVELAIDTSQAASGLVTISATDEQTLSMGGNGYFDVLAFLAAVPRGFVRGQTAWERVVTRDDP